MCASFPALKPLLTWAFPILAGTINSSYGSKRMQDSQSYQLSHMGKGTKIVTTTNCMGPYGQSTNTSRHLEGDESSTEDFCKKGEDMGVSTVEVGATVTSTVVASRSPGPDAHGNRVGSVDNSHIVKTTEVSVYCDQNGQWVGGPGSPPAADYPLPPLPLK